MECATFISIAGSVHTCCVLLEGLFAIYSSFSQLLKRCSVLPGGCAACLKAIQTKGVRSMVVLYLLLKSTNPSLYRQLPSSKGSGESYLAALQLFVKITAVLVGLDTSWKTLIFLAVIISERLKCLEIHPRKHS